MIVGLTVGALIGGLVIGLLVVTGLKSAVGRGLNW